jgi:SAM-dependent methyltransferase
VSKTEREHLLYNAYRHFTDAVSIEIRRATFGVDIGQNSWLTADEYDRFIAWLDLTADHHVLEVASGSGGPALHLAHKAGCRLTGLDSNEHGVAAASELASRAGLAGRVRFMVADANLRLPFEGGSFDALLCIDAMNHLLDRLAVLREWHRVLRPGGRAIFTDPVVITGPVTDDELALRSSVGHFLFVPPGVNERLIDQAGLALVRHEDVTENAASVSGRWRQARDAHQASLIETEGEARFEDLQRFFDAVHRLTAERRLSRIVYLVEKRAGA